MRIFNGIKSLLSIVKTVDKCSLKFFCVFHRRLPAVFAIALTDTVMNSRRTCATKVWLLVTNHAKTRKIRSSGRVLCAS